MSNWHLSAINNYEIISFAESTIVSRKVRGHHLYIRNETFHIRSLSDMKRAAYLKSYGQKNEYDSDNEMDEDDLIINDDDPFANFNVYENIPSVMEVAWYKWKNVLLPGTRKAWHDRAKFFRTERRISGQFLTAASIPPPIGSRRRTIMAGTSHTELVQHSLRTSLLRLKKGMRNALKRSMYRSINSVNRCKNTNIYIRMPYRMRIGNKSFFSVHIDRPLFLCLFHNRVHSSEFVNSEGNGSDIISSSKDIFYFHFLSIQRINAVFTLDEETLSKYWDAMEKSFYQFCGKVNLLNERNQASVGYITREARLRIYVKIKGSRNNTELSFRRPRFNKDTKEYDIDHTDIDRGFRITAVEPLIVRFSANLNSNLTILSNRYGLRTNKSGVVRDNGGYIQNNTT